MKIEKAGNKKAVLCVYNLQSSIVNLQLRNHPLFFNFEIHGGYYSSRRIQNQFSKMKNML